MSFDASAPILLCIDTSGPRLQLALTRRGMTEVLVVEIAKGHAEILFGKLAELLARNQLTYADLTRIAVTTGPGSFTGLRIGISAARGLGLALSLPVIGVPNLWALSLAVAHGPINVVLDARRDEFYLQKFLAPGKPAGPAKMISAEIAGVCKAAPGATLVSDPRVDLKALAEFALHADPIIFQPAPTYVRAADAKPQTANLVARVGAEAP